MSIDYESVKQKLAHAEARMAAAEAVDDVKKMKIYGDQIVAWGNLLTAIERGLAAERQEAESIAGAHTTDADGADRVVTTVWLRADLKGDGGTTAIECIVDTGCPYPLILNPTTFDAVARELGATVENTGGQDPSEFPVAFSLEPDRKTFQFAVLALKDSASDHGNWLGLPALALLRYSVDRANKCLVKR
mmetsp:Transcript_3588/g.11224  ORF Transcript_3588/g.11224 Transcript_3588/m.11224 type:complete len:190 (-) Transcript_3588:467-1036(-)|eukprot:CAMPEP_0174850104 /NCGR_PEP_ID=MMETSP1114-20130205/19045_1 /TAXON_ID=312471 /ORGANISM="Neobodo designis, Strain CCAP 1951/1" /LENGTH=189 /DNA_ID=CAMNT_0016084539 /DNA_START=140 /DNA_END=709 /DNA_ORIENTATION=+